MSPSRTPTTLTGRRRRVTNGRGKDTTCEYDECNRLWKVKQELGGVDA